MLIPWRNKREEKAGTPARDRALARFGTPEMENLLERLWRNPWAANLSEVFGGFGGTLRTDLSESDNDVTVRIEAPGIKPEDVDISVTGNLLTIRGEKKEETEEDRRNYHYTERQFGSFQRTVQLPSTVDPQKVEATYKDGILTITVAKQPQAKPRKIEIRNA